MKLLFLEISVTVVVNCSLFLGHQSAIVRSMTMKEIYFDRKKFSLAVFKVASSDLTNMGLTIVSYSLKTVTDSDG